MTVTSAGLEVKFKFMIADMKIWHSYNLGLLVCVQTE